MPVFNAPVLANNEFEAGLLLRETYTDNLFRQPVTADSVDDFVTQVIPYLEWRQKSKLFTSALSYTMQNVFYVDNSDFDDTYHQLQGNFGWTLVPEWLSLTGTAEYGQVTVDPRSAPNYDNTFITTDLADALSASLSPQLQHDFGYTTLEASYLAGIVEYSGEAADTTAADDSENQEVYVSWHTSDANQNLGWSAGYESQRTEYDRALPYQYDNAELGVDLGITSSWRLLARGGMETDLTGPVTSGGLDTDYWYAGFRWQPDDANLFEAEFGQRSFGDAYRAQWVRRARVLSLTASYTEEPTTQALVALKPMTAGEISEPEPGLVDDRITAEVFIQKRFDADVILTGRRNVVRLNLFDQKSEYIALDSTDKSQGGFVEWSYQVGPRTTFTLFGGTEETFFREGGDTRDNQVVCTFSRQLSPTMSASLTGGYLDRWGSSTDDYKAWYGSVEFVKGFGDAQLRTR